MHNLYQEVTEQIVAALEAGVPPWIKRWSTTTGANIPVNALTGKAYRGVNTILLWLAQQQQPQWPTSRFLTFKQALATGGHVRVGEHGVHITKYGEWQPKEAESEDDRRLYLKRYTVFNLQQCDGLPSEITALPEVKPRHHDQRDPLIEQFVATTGANVIERGERAVYIGTQDRIEMPPFSGFESADLYYATLAHEFIHWTGAKHRLDRTLIQAVRRAEAAQCRRGASRRNRRRFHLCRVWHRLRPRACRLCRRPP